MLLRFKNMATKRRSRSKLEAKFRTCHTSKISRATGENVCLNFNSSGPNLSYTYDGAPLGRQIKVWMSRWITSAAAKWKAFQLHRAT